jgi:hypothetical protein
MSWDQQHRDKKRLRPTIVCSCPHPVCQANRANSTDRNPRFKMATWST